MSAAFAVGPVATQPETRIVYNDLTGVLIYYANGSVGSYVVQFAQLPTGLALTHENFFVIA